MSLADLALDFQNTAKKLHANGLDKDVFNEFEELYSRVSRAAYTHRTQQLLDAYKEFASAYHDLEWALQNNKQPEEQTVKRLEIIHNLLEQSLSKQPQQAPARSSKRRNLDDLTLELIHWYSRTDKHDLSSQDVDELAEIANGIAAVADNSQDKSITTAAKLLQQALEHIQDNELFGQPMHSATENKLRAARNLLIEDLKGP